MRAIVAAVNAGRHATIHTDPWRRMCGAFEIGSCIAASGLREQCNNRGGAHPVGSLFLLMHPVEGSTVTLVAFER